VISATVRDNRQDATDGDWRLNMTTKWRSCFRHSGCKWYEWRQWCT